MRQAILAICLFCLSDTTGAALGQDMPLREVLVEGEGWKRVGEGYTFTEAPAADAQGTVFFADVPASRIYKVNLDGKVELWREDTERTSGLMFGSDGRLYGCQNGARRIVAYDRQGHVEKLAEDVGCNDLVVTRAGGVYWTDPGQNQVWYLAPGGKPRVVAEQMQFPNGIILWPDQQTLVVADTRDTRLWTFRIEPDGTLSHRQGFYVARGSRGKQGSGADGMTVDTDGRLYAATYAGVQVFDTQGRLSGVMLPPQNRFLSNVAFGGPQHHWLYATCSDKVYRRKTHVQGLGVRPVNDTRK